MTVWNAIGLAVLLITPALGGALAGRTRRMQRGALALSAVLLFPLLVYTVLLASVGGEEDTFWGWWLIGLAMLAVPFCAWIVIALVAFAVARSSLADAP